MGKLGNAGSSRADRSMEDELRSGFQWEKSSGLEHSCFHCTTKSNSPRALQTCYGIHSVPCSRYHQTMHAVGMSHNCEACCNFERMEDGRHRQIAELVAEFRASGNEQRFGFGASSSSASAYAAVSPPTAAAAASSSKKGKAKKKNAATEPQATPTRSHRCHQEHQQTTDAMPMSPLSEKSFNAMNSPVGSCLNAVGKGNVDGHGYTDGDAGLASDVENLSICAKSAPKTTTARAVSATPATPKLSKAELRATKRAAKQAKSQLKAVKNQTKHTVSVKSADVDFVAAVLHGVMGCGHAKAKQGNAEKDECEGEQQEDGDGAEEATMTPARCLKASASPLSRHPLPSDTCIEDVLKRNVRYVTWIREHNTELLKRLPRQHQQKTKKKGGCAGGFAAATERKKCLTTKKDHRDTSSGSYSNGTAATGSKKKSANSYAIDDVVDGLAVFEDPDAATSTCDDMDMLVDAILLKLGITESGCGNSAAAGAVTVGGVGDGYGGDGSGGGNWSSAQSAIVARLRVEIAEDLRKHETEQRMTCMRAGGFWSYAGKGVFDRMTMLDA